MIARYLIPRRTILVILACVLGFGVPALSAHAQMPHAAQGWYQLSTISSSSTVTAATFLDDQNGWAVGTNGGLFVTHNGGQTWSTIATGISDDLTMISFSDSQHGYAGGDGVFLHTSNGGRSWQVTRLATIINHWSSLSTPAGGPLFVVAKPDSALNGVYKSTDGGVSWQNVFTGTVSIVDFINPSNGFAIGPGGVFHTTDGGAAWQTIFNDGTYDLIAFASSSVAYVAKGDGNVTHLFRTTDSAASWTEVAAPDSGDCGGSVTCRMSLAFATPTQGLFGFAAIDYGSPNNPIASTNDGGGTWQSASSNLGTGASVVGYRGTIPYAISDSGFYYYGFPIPVPTDTPTNTPVPPTPTDTNVPPSATSVPPTIPAQSNGATATSTSPSRPSGQPAGPTATPTTGSVTSAPTTPAPTETAAPTETSNTVPVQTDAYQPQHCYAHALQSVVSCVQNSILRISVHLQDGDAQGTGFVVRSDHTGTYIVTNRHVLEGGSPTAIRVIAPDGRTTYRVLGVTLNNAKSGTAGDLAIIKVAATHLRPLAFGNSTRLRAGQSVASIGYGLAFQLGGPPSVTQGIVSGINRDLGDGFGAVWIQHQSVINTGNSGGPLLDVSGDVVGINTLSIDQLSTSDGSSQNVQGVFFAIPSSLAQPVITRLIAQLGHVAPTQLRATSNSVRIAAATYSVALPYAWLVNHVHRTQPLLVSRDQLVQVSVESQRRSGHFTQHDLEVVARQLVAHWSKAQRITVAHVSAGHLRGVSVAATYAKRTDHLMVTVFPTNDSHTVAVLVSVIRRGATTQDLLQASQVIASLQATPFHPRKPAPKANGKSGTRKH